MATEDQKRWDDKHAGKPGDQPPSSFLTEIFSSASWQIAPGRALDVATGRGRNACFLAERGFSVDAMDISEVGLQEARKTAEAKGLAINFIQTELEQAALPGPAYDLIVNFNFLERSLILKMKDAIKLGGHVIFETYLVDQRVLGHPRNPAFLLGHNELLELFRDFRVLLYREGKFVEQGRAAFRAGIFAQKPR
jgi:2-polyprenyl-3-methyl-5-hydroxy-6-metoxy-1,4-benzoquinol methylase